MKPLMYLALIPFQSNKDIVRNIQLVLFTHTNLIKISIDVNGHIAVEDKSILDTDDKRKRNKYVHKSRKLIELIYSDNFLSFLKKLPKTIMLKESYGHLNLPYKEFNIDHYQTDIEYVNKMLKSDIFSIDTIKTNFNLRQARYYSKCSDGEKFFFSKRSLRSIYSDCLLFSDYTSNNH